MYAKNTDYRLPTTKYAIVDTEGHGLEVNYDANRDIYCICLYLVDANGLPSIVRYRDVEKAISRVQWLLDNGWAVYAHNAKFDFGVLRVRGLKHTIKPGVLSFGCTMAMSYIKDSSLPAYGLDALTGAKDDIINSCLKAGYDVPTKKADFWNTNWTGNPGIVDIIVDYCVQDLKATASLLKKQLAWFNANSRFIAPLLWMEFPMLDLLAGVEGSGAFIDISSLHSLIDDLTKELAQAKEVIRQRYPMGLPKLSWNDEENEYQPVIKEFKKPYWHPKNISYYINDGKLVCGELNSKVTKTGEHKQSFVVYDHCKLIPYNSAAATGHNWWLLAQDVPELLELANLTKTGKPQLNKDFFEDIAEQIPESLPIAKAIKMAKYLSMAEGLLKHVQADGRIHATFANCKTRTTRLATSNPNLQNIPRPLDDKHADYKTGKDWGMRFRQLFTAPPGKTILVADLDRIEIVVLAWFLSKLMKDDGLLDVVNSGADVHQANADKWKLSRNLAKTLIFLLVYGGTAKLIHKRGFTKTLAEAEEVFDAVDKSQPSIKKLKQKVWAIIRQRGYISNPFDAHGVYQELTAKRKWLVSRGERMSFNYLIQKTARDVITLLIVSSLETVLAHAGIIVNIVHDECMIEVDSAQAEELKCKLNAIWENRYDILPGVRINGTWNTGNNWYEAK